MGTTHNSTGLTLAKRFKLRPPSKILVIMTRRIGDVLLTSPLIGSLKSAWPNSKIDVLVLENTRDILSRHPDIHQIISTPIRASKLTATKWLLSLWRRYDLAISALPSDRATLYAGIAGKYSIGLVENQPSQNWKKILLNEWVAFDDIKTHTVSMALQLASQLGLGLQYAFKLRWTNHDSSKVDELLLNHSIAPNQSYAVLHMYPKFAYKMWSTDAWVDLITWLNQKNIQVILTGSSDPDEMLYIKKVMTDLPANAINVAGKLNFAQTAYLLNKARLFVGPDTVVTHLAAAVGTPSIAIFGPSNPVKWGPWPIGYQAKTSPWKMIEPTQRVGNVLLIQGLGDCVPCLQEGCNRNINSHSQCLDELSASRVIAAAQSMLS